MAKLLKITKPGGINAVNDLVHDCYIDVADIAFDPPTAVLSFKLRKVVTTGQPWWKDFVSTSNMYPAVEGYLRILYVESYSINDTEKIGTYDFNVLHFAATSRCIRVDTNVPIDIRVKVRGFEICVEITDNILLPPAGKKG